MFFSCFRQYYLFELSKPVVSSDLDQSCDPKKYCLFVHLLKLLPGYSVKSLSCNWPLKPQFSQQCLEWDGIYQNTNLWQTMMKRSVIELKYNSSNSPYNTYLLLVFMFFTLSAKKRSIFSSEFCFLQDTECNGATAVIRYPEHSF